MSQSTTIAVPGPSRRNRVEQVVDQNHSETDQPIGFPVENWRPASLPKGVSLTGQYCRLERLDAARHVDELYTANATDLEHRIWTYLAYGPFHDVADYGCWVVDQAQGADPLFYAIIGLDSGKALGVASYLRINPNDGVIEVGHINYSPLLQKTVMATEAMFLMMRHVFDDLGYRRYEWKCDALNARSRAAAARLGFTYEGIFRQATMYKQRNRDTAWYSIIDREWPAIKAAYLKWLDPDNFDGGRQKRGLSSIMQNAR